MAKLTAKSRDAIPDRQFAFQQLRKEPIENSNHVRNAVARFKQVTGVTDAERDLAWERIVRAARRYNVVINVNGWRELR